MAIDPITAIIDAGKTVLDKFVADKMSDSERMHLTNAFELDMRREAGKEQSSFRDFVVAYEGAAEDVPKIIQIIRSLIRPAFTCLVGYLDWHYFTNSASFTDDQSSLLMAVNIIVLGFWFGERALTNSGIVDMLKGKK